MLVGVSPSGFKGVLKMKFEYENVKVIDVYDADTITVEIDLGFDIKIKRKLRFDGINAYEIKGEEKELGIEARNFLLTLINVGDTIKIISYELDKYGRVLADIYTKEGIFVNQELVESGFAIPYMVRKEKEIKEKNEVI